MKEIDLFGVFLSPFLFWSLGSFAILWGVRLFLSRIGFYRYVWHRSLFDISLYFVILALLVSFERSSIR